jgi:hypothetical protein
VINEYTIKYYLGNNKSMQYQLLISAHDKEEAEKLACIQARHRHGYSKKVNVVDVPANTIGEFMNKYAAIEPPVLKNKVNYDGCVYASIGSTALFVLGVALACSIPVWIVYTAIKIIGG